MLAPTLRARQVKKEERRMASSRPTLKMRVAFGGRSVGGALPDGYGDGLLHGGGCIAPASRTEAQQGRHGWHILARSRSRRWMKEPLSLSQRAIVC